MLAIVFILAASYIGVHSQRCAAPGYQPSPGPYNQIIFTREYELPSMLPCEGIYLPQTAIPTSMPVAVTPETTICLQLQANLPEIAVPITTTVETIMPVIPFFTELPSCPDICFSEVLTSPLGSLDPILTIYGTKEVCPLPELPVSPLSPAESPFSGLAPPFSRLMPPVNDCDCFSSSLNRVPIPPPFI